MFNRHQEIFQNLTQKYPDNRGLARAYNNSLEQGQKFEEKIRKHNRSGKDNGNKDHTGTADSSTFMPSDHQDFRNLNQTENGNITAPPDDIGQSGRLWKQHIPAGCKPELGATGGAGNITPHMPDSTNQSAHTRISESRKTPECSEARASPLIIR